MTKRLPFVFVSSTNADLRDYREALKEHLLKNHIFADTQDTLDPSNPTIKDSIRRSILQADAVICLIGTHFGTAPPSSPERSFTQIEYDVAVELNKPLYIFVTAEDWESDSDSGQAERDRELQLAHREAILEDEHYRREFTSISELLLQVSQITNSIHSECSTSPPPTSDLDLLPGLRELPELDPKAPLEETLERLLTVAITPLISWLARPAPIPMKTPREINGISTGFWGGRPTHGELVVISGTLSEFAPLFSGPPYSKRDYHQRYREGINPEDKDEHKSIINAKLGFSAGQMVWRLNLEWFDYIYAGVYRGIVRNAVPVYIRKGTYLQQVAPKLDQFKSHSIESKITARLISIPSYRTSLKALGMNIRDLATLKIEEGFALFVDSEEYPETSITSLGEPHYLDGDIWVAIRDENRGKCGGLIENMPGVNLSDATDFRTHRNLLQKKLAKDYPGYEIIYQYDQIDRLNAIQSDTLSTLKIVMNLAEINDLL
ncbi:hypothetical protein Pan153_24130 [Gimesia panareensis]|uniref:DUF4062 domain-containing protein n=1 Tax=Gimesia panareensis TaxID=2527978 RepID=A0A518FN32_9PLAN|nr:DUF4062 domain-containing protein [Gimesia panareensis]QDV17758.1 hypothetical protein Pan153_24130 [Gimesia panareensis]